MARPHESFEAEQVRQVAEGLRRLLVAVDAGETECRPEQRAYLQGAADALDELLET